MAKPPIYTITDTAFCPFCGERLKDDFCFQCVRQIRLNEYEPQTFQADIRDMRRVWCTTQAELAKNAGVKQSIIPRLESGKHHHSTRTVQRLIDGLADSNEFTLRVAPRNIPLWAMLHDEGEYIFEIMAWKLVYNAERCEQRKLVVGWDRTALELRRAAAVCKRLADWEDWSTAPPIGIFHSEGKHSRKYQDYMWDAHIGYLFRLLRKARCWWW
jgi:hypothetical protein